MAKKTELNERDAKLTQWLNEAYAKETELETDLTAHIALTEKAAYKKRLQQHLKETREHKRSVARRIKQLGAEAVAGPIPGAPPVVGAAAGKAVAAVKGQVGAARALVTDQPETHLRNAQEELREEHVEIALYLRIETFATEVGDKETAQLARRIGRDEQRMAKYLTAELPRLVKDVVRAEVPRDQRPTTSTRRRSTARPRAAASRSTTSRSGTSRSTPSRSTASRSTASRSTASRSTASRSTASRSTGSRGGATTRSRSTSRNGASASSGSTSRSPRRTTRARTSA